MGWQGVCAPFNYSSEVSWDPTFSAQKEGRWLSVMDKLLALVLNPCGRLIEELPGGVVFPGRGGAREESTANNPCSLRFWDSPFESKPTTSRLVCCRRMSFCATPSRQHRDDGAP